MLGGKIFLDRDQAGERALLGEIGHAKAAGTEHALDPEVADEFGPRWERQNVGHAPRPVAGLAPPTVSRSPAMALLSLTSRVIPGPCRKPATTLRSQCGKGPPGSRQWMSRN